MKDAWIFTSEAILATDFAKYLNTEAQQTTKHPASSNCLHADECGIYDSSVHVDCTDIIDVRLYLAFKQNSVAGAQ